MGGRLQGKAAIVTGGSRGIGQGIAELFVEEGAKVVIADINPAGQALATKLGAENALFHRTDVTVEADIEAAVAACVKAFGKLDTMVNNAGAVGDQKPLLDLDPEGFSRTCDLLLRGMALGHKHAARQFKAQGTGGAIVSISSVSGFLAGLSNSSYDAAKAGIIQLARTATFELAPLGIRSNVVAPGFTLTPIAPQSFGVDEARHQEFLDCLELEYRDIVPLRAGAWPRDIAEAVLFFASDGARNVTGQTLTVDGGFTAVMGAKLFEVTARAVERFNAQTKGPKVEAGWLSHSK